MRSVKFIALGLMFVGVTLSACQAPQPNGRGGDRRGPPPFGSLDTSGDGALTLEEFESHEIPHGDHTQVFDSIDADGDGIVTQSEYESHRPPRPPTSSR